jgi:excisionase family DNA binding protein
MDITQIAVRERWLVIQDVARKLDMSESSVRREIKLGRLTAYRFGKIIKISEGDFLKYRENCIISESEIN